MSLQKPLAPYRILEIGSEAGAFCGRILSELGASVVKLEPPGGDPMRRHPPLAGGTGISFVWFNAGKQGLTADLTRTDIQRRVGDSLASFDVLIDGNPPKWLAAHGLAPAALRTSFPHLVITSVTHFGQEGPYRDWHGSGLVDFALSGALLRSGLPDRAPTAPPCRLPLALGGISAASATVAALWERGRSGHGDWLDCSVTEAIQAQADWSTVTSSATGVTARRAGAGPLFRLFRAADGWVRVISLSVKQWEATRAWLGDPPELSGPEWKNPLFRAANNGPLDAAFNRAFAGRTRQELFDDGQTHGVGIVPVYDPSEVLADPHFRDRGTFVSFPVPGVDLARAPGAFVRMARSRPAPPAPAPAATASLDQLVAPPVSVRAVTQKGLPLGSVRVIEVGTGAVAPEIARLLGTLGADVIKIESTAQIDFMRLQGPNIESSPGWASSNRNKRSVRINLKDPGGRSLGGQLARVADVIVENNTARVMERLGLGYDEVARENPGIVYLSSQAFGASGPNASYGGFGPTNQAVSGTTFLWNHPGQEKPEGVSAIHPDHILGRMGAMAVIAALDERRRSGHGQHIDLGQAEFAMACIGEAFIESSLLGHAAPPRGNESPFAAPHGVFPCLGDDQWIAITVETDEQWARLAVAVDEPAWNDPAFAFAAGRVEHRDVIEAQLGAWTSQFPPVQLMRNLQRAGVPAGAAYSAIQVQADVHLNARGYFDTVTHPVLGTLRMEGVPYHAQNLQHAPPTAAPLLGQHTDAVLSHWLGLDEAAIQALHHGAALT